MHVRNSLVRIQVHIGQIKQTKGSWCIRSTYVRTSFAVQRSFVMTIVALITVTPVMVTMIIVVNRNPARITTLRPHRRRVTTIPAGSSAARFHRNNVVKDECTWIRPGTYPNRNSFCADRTVRVDRVNGPEGSVTRRFDGQRVVEIDTPAYATAPEAFRRSTVTAVLVVSSSSPGAGGVALVPRYSRPFRLHRSFRRGNHDFSIPRNYTYVRCITYVRLFYFELSRHSRSPNNRIQPLFPINLSVLGA